MPLRDHFRPPLDDLTSWEEFHGGWPMEIVRSLLPLLPKGFVAGPRVHHGAFVESDVSTFQRETNGHAAPIENRGGVAVAWTPARPTRAIKTDLPEVDEYEVRIYDARRHRRLVAAIEIVSPANKDRPAHRRAFVGKCAALLQQQVCVAMVDIVTTRTPNLFAELIEFLGEDSSTIAAQSELYAAVSRFTPSGSTWQFETWEEPLTIGEPLPVLPLWLSEEVPIRLSLEDSYQETCRVLQIP